jgi:periplasmic protein TonB
MMTLTEMPYPERLRAGLPTLAVHALLALAFLTSLDPAAAPLAERSPPMVALFDLARPPQPRVTATPSPRERQRRREGAASPPNLEARRAELPVLPIVLPTPDRLVAAPLPDSGRAPKPGSAAVPGPGTGSGGLGTGTGSGRHGDGPGGGGDGDGDGGGFSPPRRIRGTIHSRDYPAGAGEAGIGGTVSVIYTVEPDGRATECRVTASSGNAELDETTCRLIERRFHFRPSMDRYGRPVRSRIVQDHSWEVEDEPPTHEVRRRRRLF